MAVLLILVILFLFAISAWHEFSFKQKNKKQQSEHELEKERLKNIYADWNRIREEFSCEEDQWRAWRHLQTYRKTGKFI